MNCFLECMFTLLHFFLISSAQNGGRVDLLTLNSARTLRRSDNASSYSIPIRSGFRFGNGVVYNVYVSTDGYISMGTQPSTNSPLIPATNNIVSPYGADIDTRIAGTVSYSSFTSTTSRQLYTISALIRSRTDSSFNGNSMMIAEWNRVAKKEGVSSVTSTFQAVLITDGSISYAVFIYKCRGMEWGGATIGWAYTSSIYEEHSFSGSSAAISGCSPYTFNRYQLYKLESDDDKLGFLALPSPTILRRSLDATSRSISTNGRFNFGSGYVNIVYVSTNGYISMGTPPSSSSPSIPATTNIVSPYGADIDTRITGTVSYSSFSSASSNSQLIIVSSFIRKQTGSSFYGTRMMIAEWNGVPKYGVRSSVTSTFQAVLITDGSTSYAVFIYKCRGMKWGGATIGWADTFSIYEEHSLSGSSPSSIASCSKEHRTLVYELKDNSGTLGFLTLIAPVTLPRSHDAISSAISVNRDGFQFGDGSATEVYVSSNGYISMGVSPSTNSPEIPGTTNIVSPYGADIDTRIAGTVSYSSFSNTTFPQLTAVSSYIRNQTNSSFHGSRMMIAEWNRVAKSGGRSSITSNFQAVLIENGGYSYAVFIYECGGMEWEGATIGWAYSNSIYEEHLLSGSKSAGIGSCDASSKYRTIVYELDKCADYLFTCDNGRCKEYRFVCDGFNTCLDNSDEQNCGTSSSVNVGVAVGVSIALLVLILVGLLIFINVISVNCYNNMRKRHTHQSHTVTTTPSTNRSTVVWSTNTTTSTAFGSNQVDLPQQIANPSQQTTRPEEVSSQQPPTEDVYKGAQFSSGVPPPSYEDAIAYPSLVKPK